ncbi:unnamed protein product, partial [Meganyctiphanes norvegica]
GAELFAINRALHWLVLNQPLIQNQEVVILTDSLSGIMALENHHHRSYSTITNQILNVANILKESTANLTIQWVPSHVGLTGNEKADSLAKEAHNLVSETEAALDPKEMNNRLKSTCLERYQQQNQVEETYIR